MLDCFNNLTIKLLELIKKKIPKNFFKNITKIFSKLSQLWYRGSKNICPCCGNHFRKFMPFLAKIRKNAQCPKCGALERHRLIWLYLKNETNILSANLKVLHFGPILILQKNLKYLPNLNYISADLNSSIAMIKMDITNILYKNNTFDVILCNHVLEHVIDDHKAMQELYRVLKPGGWAILQSPVDFKLDETFENVNIVSPEDRERFFGQKDHVRIYGRDYEDRLMKVGFNVKIDKFARKLGTEKIKKYGLVEEGIIFYCTKLN